MRGKRLDLVQGVGLPAVVDLDHGVRETRPQLGRQLSNVTPRRGSLANGASIPRVSLDRALALGASLDLPVGHALS